MSDREPTIEIIDNRLYVAGIHVFREQLTPDELKKYFPEDYLRKYDPGKLPCPVPGCSASIRSDDKRSLVMHARQKHSDWYRQHRKAISQAKNLNEFNASVSGKYLSPINT